MGSPVSVVVAEIVMQHVEERALATRRQTIPLWLRYVDDTFTAIHKDEIDAFHDHLNLRSGVPYIFCRGAKVRLIQLLEYLSVASPESGLFSDWSRNKKVLRTEP